MKNFRRICFAMVLAAAFTVPALAGDTQSPPCADPGQTDTPPCSTAPGETQGPNSAAPGETQGSDDPAPGETQGTNLAWSVILLTIQGAL
jgi:hypothetical protein